MSARHVSAIMATCNRACYLREALDSVLEQTVTAAQVIVVDDGSTDSTAEVLARYGDRIEVIEQDNGGKSRALNRAMPRVRGDYVWIFDDDDIALPSSLERHLAVFETWPRADFVYSGGSILRSLRGGRVELGGRTELAAVPEDEIFLRMLENNFMQQQAMLVRTRCYREVGPFDTRLDRSQDYEMNLRLARHYRGKRLDAATFLFRQHDGPRGRPGARFPAGERRERWIESNRRLLRRLRAELELAEYLPRGLHGGELDARRRRRALLQRACVMARCGLWDEAFADLGEALLDTMPGAPLDAAEQDICRRTLGPCILRHVAIESLVGDQVRSRRLKHLVDEAGNADVGRIFASELSRYAWARLRRGRTARAASSLVLAWSIAGLRGCLPRPRRSRGSEPT